MHNTNIIVPHDYHPFIFISLDHIFIIVIWQTLVHKSLGLAIPNINENICNDYHIYLVSSVRRALSSKLKDPGFKSQPDTVGGPVTIIMWGARPG